MRRRSRSTRRSPTAAVDRRRHGGVVAPSLLREGAFRRLWVATTASGLATWALPFVLGVAVARGELTAGALGIALGVRTAGFLVAVPLAGVLADRWSRRGVVVGSSAAAAVATPAVALLLDRPLASWAGALALLAAFVVGAGQGACRPAFQAMTADVVPVPQRQQANAWISLAVRATTVVAPGVIALLAGLLGTTALLWLTAATWVVAALLPPGRRRGDGGPLRAPRAGVVEDLGGGLREARRHRWFLAGQAALALVVLTGYSVTAVVLPMVSGTSYGGTTVLAACLTGYTLGALMTAVALSRWRPPNAGWAALGGLALYAATPLALLVLPAPWVLVGAYAVAGVGLELFNVVWFTAVQAEVPSTHLARVSSLDFLVSYGLAPLGLAAIAPAIWAFGVGPVLLACAVTCLLAPALAALVPSSRHFVTPRPGEDTAPGVDAGLR